MTQNPNHDRPISLRLQRLAAVVAAASGGVALLAATGDSLFLAKLATNHNEAAVRVPRS